jgi:hypothetical protein
MTRHTTKETIWIKRKGRVVTVSIPLADDYEAMLFYDQLLETKEKHGGVKITIRDGDTVE